MKILNKKVFGAPLKDTFIGFLLIFMGVYIQYFFITLIIDTATSIRVCNDLGGNPIVGYYYNKSAYPTVDANPECLFVDYNEPLDRDLCICVQRQEKHGLYNYESLPECLPTPTRLHQYIKSYLLFPVHEWYS